MSKYRNTEQRKSDNDRSKFRKYGITPEEYEARLVLQDGRCAVCRGEPTVLPGGNRVLVVDHSHKSGRTRGLLCYRCNSALGQLKDSPSVHRNMIRYLEIHGT